MLFLLVALLLYAGYFIYHAYNLARSRGELNYAESTWLFASLRIRHGLTPYFAYTQAPYIPMVYPPLLPAIVGWVGALFGTSDEQTVTLSRLVSLGSALVISALIAALCRFFRVGGVLSIVAGLLFLTPYTTFQLWSLAARSDMLAVALELSAITLVCGASIRERTPMWTLFLAGVVCGFALSAKQTSGAAVLALVLWVLLGGIRANVRYGKLAGLVLIGAGAALGILAVLLPFGIEGVQQLLRGTWDLATQPQSASDFYTRLDELVRLFGLCLPLAALGFWSLTSKRPEDDNSELSGAIGLSQLFLLYAAVSTVAFLATISKVGSASSYSLEIIAILCVAVGLGLGNIDKLLPKIERQAATALIIFGVASLSIQSWYAIKTAQSTQEAGPNDLHLASMARVGEGPILSENGYILLHGADPPFLLDPLFLSVQNHLGEWDDSTVVRMADERQFVSVVLFHTLETRPSVNGIPWLPEGLYDALLRNYQLAGASGRYYVYLPKIP